MPTAQCRRTFLQQVACGVGAAGIFAPVAAMQTTFAAGPHANADAPFAGGPPDRTPLVHEAAPRRVLREERIEGDLVVVGGGMAGTCAAITAAREGLKVVLVQDRPVLGGNASSEVRLWILGATAHMANNNRWSREGGVIDEFLVENTYRNPEGNPVFVDALLLEMATREPNLTLLLNTAVFEVGKRDDRTIAWVRGFCSQNATLYDLRAPLFCDASGDGIVGYLAGAPFRMGAEERAEFGEAFAPDEGYGELLGHTIYFYSRDAGKPVRYVPPAFALDDITEVPRHQQFAPDRHGCTLWWIEYGGRLDTVHDTEAIKWELWKVAYGAWDYIKNSGKFPEAETLTLEWVGLIPGKRESRRFEGDYMLTQADVVEQRTFADAVSVGGWSIDLHPADGVYSDRAPCNQWHAKGVYQVPFRCMYAGALDNLLLAGRILSVSHVAFGSTRVMATCAHNAQAVGAAAALCRRLDVTPRDLTDPQRMPVLQRTLLRAGQFIPGVPLDDPEDLARTAEITASSTLVLNEIPADGPGLSLDNRDRALLLPLAPGATPRFTFRADVARPTTLHVALRAARKRANFTPDELIAETDVALAAGENVAVPVAFDAAQTGDAPEYRFICFSANPDVALRGSNRRVTGVLALFHAPGHGGYAQRGGAEIGFEDFAFWLPERRPGGHLPAFVSEPGVAAFQPAWLTNGYARPYGHANAWAADPADPAPRTTVQWAAPQTIARIALSFDTDFDHAMESVQRGHPESVMPFCVRAFRVRTRDGELIASREDNHQTRVVLDLDRPVTTDALVIEADHPDPNVPAALFEIRCYAPGTGGA